MITKNSRSIEREFLLERVISDGLPCDIPVSYTHLDVYKRQEYGMTIRPIEEYHGEPVYKVVFIAPNEACLAEAKQLYEDQFIFCESRLGDTPSAIVNGELINRKFNKGTGIKAICDELGCSLADTCLLYTSRMPTSTRASPPASVCWIPS